MVTTFRVQSFARNLVVCANPFAVFTALEFTKACLDVGGMVGLLLPQTVDPKGVDSFFERTTPVSTSTPKPRSLNGNGSSSARLFRIPYGEVTKESLKVARSGVLMNAEEVSEWRRNSSSPSKLPGVEAVVIFSSVPYVSFLQDDNCHDACLTEAVAVFSTFYHACRENSTRGFTFVFVLPEAGEDSDLDAYWAAARRIENGIRSRMDELTCTIAEVPVNAVVCLSPPSVGFLRSLFQDHLQPDKGLSPWGQRYLSAFRDVSAHPSTAVERSLVYIDDIATVVMQISFDGAKVRGNVIRVDGGAFRIPKGRQN